MERKDLIGTEFQGRKASHVIDLPPAGTFPAFHEAERHLKELGYTVGSMCINEPIGFALGYDYVAKWYNLSQGDKRLLHGLLLPLDEFREGGARIVFFETPHLDE